MKIAFQGEHGAYSEAAVLDYFTKGVEPVPCESFEKVFEGVESGTNDYGLIPIENSLAGSIHQNYDLILKHALSIVGERYLRVRHCLIANPGVKLSEIRQVISHPQALAQSNQYLKSLGKVVEIKAVYDTAGAVKLVRDQKERSIAAVASQRAAEFYGMEILAEGIEDHLDNFTRFLLIGVQPVFPEKEAKTSIVFTLQNKPGALFRSLSVLALRDLDLTKIESRPDVGKLWEYLFYVDFIGSTSDPVVKRAMENLEEYTLMLRILGSYPRHKITEALQ
ncbi:MAG: prephenate dehydratase [Anaerolineaceae bacterium]|nr:prephenate dehydratase [Anaerolineaceae bacterium]